MVSGTDATDNTVCFGSATYAPQGRVATVTPAATLYTSALQATYTYDNRLRLATDQVISNLTRMLQAAGRWRNRFA